MCKDTGENAALEYEVVYENVAISFLTDYDKENPLTSQNGTARLLDL